MTDTASRPVGYAGGVPAARHVLVHRVPGRARRAADCPVAVPPCPAGAAAPAVPHGTTIVALTFAGGVLMAGDRRATMGNLIANREMEKVFPADDYSCVGIAGTAGLAVELVRLFQVELEHYEKIEGALLSLDGKANRLSDDDPRQPGDGDAGAGRGPAVRRLRPASAGVGRIFSYDVTGGRYEEHEHHSVGSGSLFARGSLKKLWRPGLDRPQAVRVAVEALYDAADDDSATGGPGPDAADLAGGRHGHRRRLPAASPDDGRSRPPWPTRRDPATGRCMQR